MVILQLDFVVGFHKSLIPRSRGTGNIKPGPGLAPASPGASGLPAFLIAQKVPLSGAKPGSLTETQAALYRDRSSLLSRLGRDAEALSDLSMARGIPPRDPQTPAELIDLSAFYNAGLKEHWNDRTDNDNDLSELPSGLQMFGGVKFDVRGIVQLAGLGINKIEPGYPESVNGIAVDRQCSCLHFLQATGWWMKGGTQVGSYIVHYSDGQHCEIPIVYGKDVRDWQADQAKDLERASTAWRGRNQRLLQSTWENPRPQIEITTIDYVSAMTTAAPFLIAITAED